MFGRYEQRPYVAGTHLTASVAVDAPKWNEFWPEGLRSLFVNLIATRDGVDVEALGRDLARRGLHLATDKTRSTTFVRGVGASEGFMARVRYLNRLDDAALPRHEIDLDIRLGPAEGTGDTFEAVDLTEVFSACSNAFITELDKSVFSIGHFDFDRALWKPPFALPMTLPAIGVVAGSAPEIEGFEFSYPDPVADLKRANVALREPDRLAVSLLVRTDLDPPDRAVNRLCSNLLKHLPTFATKTQSQT